LHFGIFKNGGKSQIGLEDKKLMRLLDKPQCIDLIPAFQSWSIF